MFVTIKQRFRGIPSENVRLHAIADEASSPPLALLVSSRCAARELVASPGAQAPTALVCYTGAVLAIATQGGAAQGRSSRQVRKSVVRKMGGL